MKRAKKNCGDKIARGRAPWRIAWLPYLEGDREQVSAGLAFSPRVSAPAQSSRKREHGTVTVLIKLVSSR